ncbi:MAG: hypothetical protein JHC33_07975 [Ignisphaera sp.]|nr:hypothetical protein [Ignisphaera sp.]
MSDYPKFQYHPVKGGFICPSQEFLNTLTDASEYEDEPFTGPRANPKPKPKPVEPCKTCLSLEADNIDLKLEVERLRIALKMAENKVPEHKGPGRPPIKKV